MTGWRLTKVRVCPKCHGPLHILLEDNVIHFMFRCDKDQAMVPPHQALKP
jgi:hypothetical protein